MCCLHWSGRAWSTAGRSPESKGLLSDKGLGYRPQSHTALLQNTYHTHPKYFQGFLGSQAFPGTASLLRTVWNNIQALKTCHILTPSSRVRYTTLRLFLFFHRQLSQSTQSNTDRDSWKAQNAAIGSTGRIAGRIFTATGATPPKGWWKGFCANGYLHKGDETKGLLKLSGIFAVFTRYPQSCGQIPAGLITIITSLHIPPATTNGYRACLGCLVFGAGFYLAEQCPALKWIHFCSSKSNSSENPTT